MRVSVIIPTHNEVQAIGRVLADLPSHLVTELIFTEPFYDVVVASDLTRLAAELRLAPARAPRTAAWLNEWANSGTQLRMSAGNL